MKILFLLGISTLAASAAGAAITDLEQYAIPNSAYQDSENILKANPKSSSTLLRDGLDKLERTKGKHHTTVTAARKMLQRTYELKYGLQFSGDPNSAEATAMYCLTLSGNAVPPFADVAQRRYRATLLNVCSKHMKQLHGASALASANDSLLFKLGGSEELIGFSPTTKQMMVADSNEMRIKLVKLDKVEPRISSVTVTGKAIDDQLWNRTQLRFPYVDSIRFKYCTACESPEITIGTEEGAEISVTAATYLGSSDLGLVKYERTNIGEES